MDTLAELTKLIQGHRVTFVRAARRQGLSAEDAVEVAQDALATFLQIMNRGEAPSESSEWVPFVVRITQNAARNRRRRHHLAAQHDSFDPAKTNSIHADLPPNDSPEEILALAEEHVRLRACVDRLCGTQRSVVMLRLLEERAGEDVASELGITRGHVDVLLHRAKASLRECMLE